MHNIEQLISYTLHIPECICVHFCVYSKNVFVLRKSFAEYFIIKCLYYNEINLQIVRHNHTFISKGMFDICYIDVVHSIITIRSYTFL